LEAHREDPVDAVAENVLHTFFSGDPNLESTSTTKTTTTTTRRRRKNKNKNNNKKHIINNINNNTPLTIVLAIYFSS